MELIQVADMQDQQTSINADAESAPQWASGKTYEFNDEVLYGGDVYVNVSAEKGTFEPTVDTLVWVYKRPQNKYLMYDVYPQTATEKTNGTLTVSWSVTNVDSFYVGSVHGETVSINVGGTVYSQSLVDTITKPNTVWGLPSKINTKDFYQEFPLFTGTITVTVTKSPNDNLASIGFINYGKKIDLGSTIVESSKMSVKSGVKSEEGETENTRTRATSSKTLDLTAKINEDSTLDAKDILDILETYRGVPTLIVGDSEEYGGNLIFWGIYYNIYMQMKNVTTFSISMNSLSYTAFTPATQSEIAQQELKAEQEALLFQATAGTLKQVRVNSFDGVPTINDFVDGDGVDFLFDATNPCNLYYNDNGTVAQYTNYDVAGFNGVPTMSDFVSNGINFYFNIDSPCDLYYLDGGTVKKCKSSSGVGDHAGVPTVSTFSDSGNAYIFNSNSPCDVYYLDGGTVKKCVPSVDYSNAVPSVADFNLGRDVIFRRNGTVLEKYVLISGVVTLLKENVTSKAGVPTSSDFGNGTELVIDRNTGDQYFKSGSNIYKKEQEVTSNNGVPPLSMFTTGGAVMVVDSSDPCTSYYNNGGTVTPCPTGFGVVTGVPTASDFDKHEFITDRSSPCDMYYLDGGTVTKCGGSGGGGSGGVFEYKHVWWANGLSTREDKSYGAEIVGKTKDIVNGGVVDRAETQEVQVSVSGTYSAVSQHGFDNTVTLKTTTLNLEALTKYDKTYLANAGCYEVLTSLKLHYSTVWA